MIIDEHSIPDVIVSAACSLVDRIDAKWILQPSSLTNILFQGNRVIPKNVPIARQRIKSRLRADRPLDPYIETLLRSGGLADEVVVVLSEAALQVIFSDLVSYYGEADFLLAVLLDERESVRDLAHDFIDAWDGQTADAARRKEAKKTISDTFASFISHIRELLGETLPPVSSTVKDSGQAATDKPDKALAAVKAELLRVKKKAEKQRLTLQKKIDQGQIEIDRLQSDLVSAHNDSKAHETAFSEAKSALTELQASLKQRIEEGINKALSDELRQWLKPVKDVEDAVKGAGQGELLDQVANVLEKQRTVDLNCGNRSTLRQMIEDRRQLLTEVGHARIDALNPLPELRSLADQLECEINDLENRLGLPSKQLAAVAKGLKLRINEVETLDELKDVRQFIQQTATYNLLNREDLYSLYRALDGKAGLLYDKIEIFDKAQVDSPKTRFSLRHSVANGESFTIFIDGHNALFELKDIFGQYYEDGLPGTKARLELGNRLTRIFHKPGADVLLYFDSDDSNQHSLSDQVRVIYSGGTGDHRADKAILQHLMVFNLPEPSAPVCLVTKDTDFACQANEMGVIIMHPEEFAVLVDLESA